MSALVEYRKLVRNGKCTICGKKLLAGKEKVIYINYGESVKLYRGNICKDCIIKLNDMVNQA